MKKHQKSFLVLLIAPLLPSFSHQYPFIQQTSLSFADTSSVSSPKPLVDSNEGLLREDNGFVKLAKTVIQSVVNISTFKFVENFREHPLSPFFYDERFRRFFGDLDQDFDNEEDTLDLSSNKKMRRRMALGSGFIISLPEGSLYIVTNHHVVKGSDEIEVSFTEEADEAPSMAEIIGFDAERDIAICKVPAPKRKMIPLTLGDSDKTEIGELVLAVGNPFGQGHSVTHGIISQKERKSPGSPLNEYLQTDAPINPGNSGGPLVNSKGEAIGMNTIKFEGSGVSLAIPINSSFKAELRQLIENGKVERGFIGVSVSPLTPQVARKIKLPQGMSGPVVTMVTPDGPAAKAGLEPYDVIYEFNHKRIRDGSDLVAAVALVEVGKKIEVKIYRSGQALTLPISVGSRSTIAAHAEPKNQQFHGMKEDRLKTGLILSNLTPELTKKLGLSEDSKGVYISQVAEFSPARKASLIKGDVILKVENKEVQSVQHFFKLVSQRKSYLLLIRRSRLGGEAEFSVTSLELGSE